MTDHMTVGEWNHRYPPGTPVRYWPGFREGEGRKGVTRTYAYKLAGHTPVVMVNEHRACIALTHVTPAATRRGCICGPDVTGEDIDMRPDCPAHNSAPGQPDEKEPF